MQQKDLTQLILLLTIWLFQLTAFSQETAKSATINSSTTVYIVTNNMNVTIDKLQEFMGKNAIHADSYILNDKQLTLKSTMNYAQYLRFDSLVKKLGFESSRTDYNFNMEELIDKDSIDIELIKAEINQYQVLIDSTSTGYKEKFFNYYEKIIALQKELKQKEINLSELQKSVQVYKYELHVYEETNATQTSTNNWVNMPGIEYSALFIEQPLNDYSPSIMNGISLKYLFNTGKSYALLGLYKSYATSSTTQFTEMYTFGLGQDFYSKYLGRGKRKWLNLYSSFNAGVYIASGETVKERSWYVNPYIGLEIFKNKYILLDNKVGYFLPYKSNRNMRGLLYNISFNFAF